MKINWDRWGPLTVGIVAVSVIVAVFTGCYVIVVQPSTDQIIGFLKALGEFAGSTAGLAIAHAIWKHGEDQAEAAIVTSMKPPSDAEEAEATPRPESALVPVDPGVSAP